MPAHSTQGVYSVVEETNPVEDLPADENDGSDVEENDGSGTVSEGSGN